MKTLPTKVEFDQDSFAKLKQEFQDLQDFLQKKEETIQSLEYFFQCLQKVADLYVEEPLLRAGNYHLTIRTGGIDPLPRIEAHPK